MKKQIVLFCILVSLLLSCSEGRQNDNTASDEPPASGLSGKELATAHCSRCHAFVSPDVLPKKIWRENVLPAMGHRMGIYNKGVRPDSLFDPGVSGAIVRNANIYPEQPVLAKADWDSIVQYFVKNAPDTIPAPVRSHPIRIGLKHFKYRETSFSYHPAFTTMVKILPDNRGIIFNDSKPRFNSLTFLTPGLKEHYSIPMQSTPVQFDERSNEAYLTTAGGGIFPTDAPFGAVQQMVKTGPDKTYKPGNIVISGLQRPVCMAYGDLNKDGLVDMVACEFGNETGELAWYENNGKGGYSKNVLRAKPGAIRAIIKDANNDGLPDIYVLMAQADEGVFLYENLGAGKFREKRLLSFLPVNGSQYIELADFNKDGFDDIVYVCGDNADKTPILKSYHGIYIFLNDGKGNFRQAYFYQLNGAYKAIVRDFDLDGDLDIAAISFFPDYRRYPEESFVYLENKGHLKFDDYSFPQASRGRWIVMDAGDMDGDGDTDIALGSFVYFIPDGDTTGLGKKWLVDGPSVVVLENTTR
ncbi:MAG: VCBS repeat-containing protein [Sphingobacteriales bacterium]|nr:VCBS repeat-containing protein [Sphingobacteriales bacterium]OJY88401.1 MAG: hypothetical protein BGP14_13275 [Sphingobacteriales bacterium 44-15]